LASNLRREKRIVVGGGARVDDGDSLGRKDASRMNGMTSRERHDAFSKASLGLFWVLARLPNMAMGGDQKFFAALFPSGWKN
jgi:hypothetical protein